MRRALGFLSARGSAGRELLAFAALVAGAAGVVLATVSVQGSNRTRSDSAHYQERGVFDYSAVLGRGVYDGDELRTPQPLFRRLGERLPVHFRYEVSGVLPTHPVETVRGSYALTVEVRQSNGWARSIPVVPFTPFEGDSFQTEGVIDLTQLSELVRRLEAETGFKSAQFRVRLLADVQFAGMIGGQRIGRPYQQVLEFALSDVELRLDSQASKVSQSVDGEVLFDVVEPRLLTVPVVGARISYGRLPALAHAALGVAGAIGIVVALATLLHGREDVAALPARYERLVTDVAGFDGGGGRGGSVAVNDLDALFRLAEQYQLPVLRSKGPAGASYWLLAETTYVYGAPVYGGVSAISRSTPGPAPPFAWAAPPVRADTSPSATSPSSPLRREGLSASAPSPWAAPMADIDPGPSEPGSLALGRVRPRAPIDARWSPPRAVNRPRARSEDGRLHAGSVWPHYDDRGRRAAA